MKKIIFTFLVIIIFFGCKKDDDNNSGHANVDPVTFIIQSNEIISVSETTIILSGTSNDFVVNDIIVSGVAENAPYGFLRKITNIQTQNSNTVLSTQHTTLEEGLKYFNFSEEELQGSFNHTFTQDEEEKSSSNRRQFSIYLPIDETITDGNTTINLNGALEITPTITVEIIISRNLLGLPKLEKVYLNSQTENTLAITLSCNITSGFDQEILLGTLQGPPITVYIGIPVVINPSVSLSIGANGHLNASLTYSYENNSTFSAGILYQENWQFPDTNGFVVNSSDASTTVNVSGEARIFIKPEFAISLYDQGFVSTGINVEPYARFEGNINSTGYEYGIYGGITTGAFFNASIFGFNLIDRTWNDLISIPEYEIASGSSNVSLPTVTTSAITNITESSAQSGGNVTNEGTSNVTARGVCWHTSANPTIANNFTSNGTGTGSFVSDITGLNENTTYYVRAYATNNEGTAYGNEYSFTTLIENSNVDPVFNPSPGNGASNIPLNGSLSFTAGANTPSDTTFKVYFDTNPNPTNVYNLNSGQTSLNYTNLAENTTYYWKVETISAANEVLAVSSIWSFNTVIVSGGGTYNGNVILETQQEVDDFGVNNYSEITGNLNIFIFDDGFGGMITDLSPLAGLMIIGGELNINDPFLYLSSFEGLHNIQSIGGRLRLLIFASSNLESFNNLEYIGGSLEIINGANLENLVGFENLSFIGGGIRLSDCSLITDLNGISHLSILLNNKSISIESNSNLVDISGIFNNLTTLSSLSIQHNSSLFDFSPLINITEINQQVFIVQGLLNNLSFFDNLNFVGGVLNIAYNNSLTNFCGLNNLILNGGILEGNYNVHSNAYNPTFQDIINGDCSQ